MTDKKSISFALLLALIVLLCGCSLSSTDPQTNSNPATPKNDTGLTFTIQEVTLQIASATRQASYENVITQQVYTPNDVQQDEVLVVEAKVLSGNIDTVSGWVDVWITDENGRQTSPGSVTTLANGTVIWPVVVQKSSHAFMLHLPDSVTVALDSVVK